MKKEIRVIQFGPGLKTVSNVDVLSENHTTAMAGVKAASAVLKNQMNGISIYEDGGYVYLVSDMVPSQ